MMPEVLPTVERAKQQGGLELVRGRYRARCEHRLDDMLVRGHVDERQHEAGMRLFRDFYFAGICQERGIPLDAVKVDGGGAYQGMTDKQVDAKMRFDKALAAISRTSASVLWWVVLLQKGLYDYARQHGCHKQYVPDRLREALDELSEHYGA